MRKPVNPWPESGGRGSRPRSTSDSHGSRSARAPPAWHVEGDSGSLDRVARACRPSGRRAALFFPWMKDREGNPFLQECRLVVKGPARGVPNPGSTPLPISAEFPLRWQVPFLLTPNLEFEHSNLLPRDVGHGCLSMNSRNVTTVLDEPVFHHLQDVVGAHRSDPLQLDPLQLDPLQLDLGEPLVFLIVEERRDSLHRSAG